MKIVAISDMHGYLKDIPECDLLIIAGDISPLRIQSDTAKMLGWLEDDFMPWLERQFCQKVVLVAGNHDFIFETDGIQEEVTRIFDMYSSWFTYLENETVKIDIDDHEISIFGTPYCSTFGNWPFMYEDDLLVDFFKEIPSKVDIIVSHDAPYGTSDVCSEGIAKYKGHIGNKPLTEALKNVEFKYLLHGHLHTSNHEAEELNGGLVYNVSLLNEDYKPEFEPLEIEI